ncbi:hypothetical protein MSG28_000838 [Choristoneura fumiferana]|uniref:Uncharacterized protein n=1 Tax=Choristoneura fumiferana TaxID=7141 RepID=A0ACC0K2N6_CHOFU|nr:hypothetical protein MSG28_000838 [Choristoneura fumiferana]
MCNLACGITTLVLGAILVFTSSFVGYGLVDGFIKNMIADEVALHEGTVQMERFETIPFPLTFKIRVFNITNSDEVLTGGVPVVNEIGPYIYKFLRTRSITDRGDDTLDYYITDQFEFDAEGSYPHTEDDLLTIANVPYHAILQVAEVEYEELMGALSLGLSGVFGNLNAPIMTVRARDLFLDGLPICASPGALGRLPCTAIRGLAASSQNIEQRPDGSMSFSLFGYRNGFPSPIYKVRRGINDPQDVARIFSYDNSLRLRKWPEGDDGSIAEDSPNQCNSINGTDTGVHPPFLDRNRPIFASVELRFQFEHELFGVPALQYSANEWYLDNHQGCFCLNLTRGVTGPDGCLLSGAMELYSCVGVYLSSMQTCSMYSRTI